MEILSFPPRQQMEVVAGGEYKTFTESELDFGEEVGGTSGAGRPKLVQIPAPSASSSLSLSQCQCHCPFTDKNPLPLVTDSQRVTWTPFAILAMFYLTNSKLLQIKHAHPTKFQWIFITAAVVRNVACSKVKRQMYTG